MEKGFLMVISYIRNQLTEKRVREIIFSPAVKDPL